MITATRISRALGILGVVGFLAHATTSLATSGAFPQDPTAPPEPAPAASAVDDAPLPSAPEPVKDLAPLPSADVPTLPGAPGAAKDLSPIPARPEPVKDLPPPPDEPALDLADPPLAPLPAEESNPLPPARDLKPRPAPAVPPAPSGGDDEDDHPVEKPSRRAAAADDDPADDPDALARSFLQRNRREAEEQLKALRDESARLKSRLARVEAGIRRWESLADALDRSGQEKAAVAAGANPRAGRSSAIVPYGAPVGGVIIQSQPVTRSDLVPIPQPR